VASPTNGQNTTRNTISPVRRLGQSRPIVLKGTSRSIDRNFPRDTGNRVIPSENSQLAD